MDTFFHCGFSGDVVLFINTKKKTKGERRKKLYTNADADLFMLLAGTDKRQSLQIKGKYSTVFLKASL